MRKVVFFIMLAALAMPSYTDELQDRIDRAFSAGNTDEIKAVIAEKSTQEGFEKVESYIIENVKKSIIAGNYSFAGNVLDQVLLNNLDNVEAQDLYISLEKVEKEKRLIEEKKLAEEARKLEEERLAEEKRLAEEERKREEERIKQEQEQERLAEEQRLLEEQRIKEENERLKEITKALEEEKNTAAEKAVSEYIRTENDKGYFTFKGELGAIDLILYRSGFFSDVYDKNKTSYRYGLSLGGSVFYYKAGYSGGLDLSIESYFLEIYPESASVFSWKVAANSEFLATDLPVYARLGLTQTKYNYPSDVGEDMYITSLISPVLGIGLRDYQLTDRFYLNGIFDFYLVSFMTSYFDGAFDSQLGLKYDLPDYKKYDFYVKSNLTGTFVLGDNNIENNLKLQIIAGAGINYGKK